MNTRLGNLKQIDEVLERVVVIKSALVTAERVTDENNCRAPLKARRANVKALCRAYHTVLGW